MVNVLEEKTKEKTVKRKKTSLERGFCGKVIK